MKKTIICVIAINLMLIINTITVFAETPEVLTDYFVSLIA